MDIKSRLEDFKKIISSGDIEIAIKDFIILLPELKESIREEKFVRVEKRLIKISADYNSLLKTEADDIVDYEILKTTNSKILFSLLTLIHDVEKIFFAKNLTDKKIASGLIRINPKKAMELAMKEIENSQSMKVIGLARQNFAEVSTSNNHVLKYYNAIEEKLKDKTITGKPFYIKRVTQHILRDKFKNHLKSCFEIVEDSKNQYEIVLYGNLKITYTYYIINSYEEDKSILFLTLNTKDINIDLIDNTLMFYTKDMSIINKFNLHFDQFWNNEGQKGRVIKNLSDFKKYIPFDLRIYDKYNDIKNFIKRVPNDSVRVKHLRHEINMFHRRLKGLDSCMMTYTHSNKNQRISDCFTDYVKDLEEGNKFYRTISVKGFWETLYDIQDFLEKQELSLYKGATIERIYLVNSNDLNKVNDSKAEEIAIPRNYLQHVKYPNYNFRILFSTDEREIIRRENYAIWGNEDIAYKVLFLIKYGTSPNATTELSFANFSNLNDAHMYENQRKLDDYEARFDQAMKRVKEQNLKIIKYLENKKSTNLKIEDEAFETQLDFLRRNGIIDIENFLK